MSEEPKVMNVVEDSFEIVKTLGELPPGAVVTEKALADMFGRHPASIKRAIERGELPPPAQVIGKPRWTVKAILVHIEVRLEAAKQKSEADAARIAELSP